MKQGNISTGHPVNVSTGILYSTHEDIFIPGKLALTWERFYSSALLENTPSTLGPGWTTRYFATLEKSDDEFRFFTPEGELEIFADPDKTVENGGVVRNLSTFQELSWKNNRYIVTRWDVETGEIERYIFEKGRDKEPWPLTGIEEVTGQGLDMIYDEVGRLVGIRQRLERRALQIHYFSNDRISGIFLVSPAGNHHPIAQYEYDFDGRLCAAHNALGEADYYEYDTNSRITREILKDGGVFIFKYDEKNRCLKISSNDGYDEKTFRYLDSIGWTEVTNSLGQVSRYEWMPSGQVVCEIDPMGGTKKTEYDEWGRFTAKIDATGATTKYEYDEMGNRYKILNALGLELNYTFNEHHLPLKLIDTAGNIWKRYYDDKCQIQATENPLGGRWTYGHDINGNIISITNPNGARRTRFVSQNGDLLAETDWEGHNTYYKTDDFGRFVEKTDPLGNVTFVEYDPLGHPKSIILPDGSRISCQYDSAGNLIKKTDANGHTNRLSYGSCGRILEREDSLGNVVQYQWGSEPKRLEKIVNENGETYTFTYDEAGRVTREIGFDGKQVQLFYDPAGRCISTVNGLGEKTSYQMDELGQLRKKILPDGNIDSFDYDNSGNLISAVNSTCEIRFERDLLGRVLKEFQGEYIIEREYDSIGNVTKLTTSLGHELNSSFDANGLLSSLETKTGYQIRIERNALGREVGRRLPGGIKLTQEFDSMSQLITQQVFIPKKQIYRPGRLTPDGTSVIPPESKTIERYYEYDKTGNVTSIRDGRWGSTRYIYDPVERLLDVICERGTDQNLSYDKNGNLTKIHTQSLGGQSLEYGPGNRLLRQGSTKYFYDDNGRITSKVENFENSNSKEWRFLWDSLDQLTSVITPEGTVWRYKYDAFGRRISKEDANTRTMYVWDQDVIMHEVGKDAFLATWVFNRANFHPILKIQENSLYPVICDHLGTPKELLNDRGEIVWEAKHHAWGALANTQRKGVDCPIRLRGQWFDDETGLCYNRFRYYDPANGRYISPDPIGLRGGLNQYVFARNPINWVDPFGLTETGCNGNGDDDEAAELARRDAERHMREEDALLSDHDKEFYGGEGVIYRVPGSGTPSGKPYVGSADDLDVRTRTATDGRDRSQAQRVGSYPIGDRAARRRAEQNAIVDEGGIANLDNKRNEIAE